MVTPSFKDDETGGERLAAEELARELLQGETISSGDIVRLSMALPSEVPSRGRNSQGRSVRRLLVRDVSKQYPLSTRVFARFIRQLSKDFTCTTIAVLQTFAQPFIKTLALTAVTSCTRSLRSQEVVSG